MPHVTFVPMTGFRVRESEMLKLGMSLPGLKARAQAIGELPALGVLTLAGLTPESWTCSYRGTARCNDEAVETIISDKPDLVAISALTASIDEAYVLSGRLRAYGVPVVMGGLHVTACPQEAEANCDAVIVGRGEAVWTKVLHDAAQGQLQARYMVDRGTLPLWPAPRMDLLPDTPARFTLQTQTGCPFSCGFCGASRLLGKFYEKPIANIRAELSAICRINPRPLIELADDNTFAGSRNMDEFFDVFEQSNTRWFTEADWRIGERPEILNRLAASGCMQILVGLESLVFRYPGMGDKQAEMNRMMDAVSAIQDAGVAVNGCFIAGAAGETPDSLQRLTEFVLNSPLAAVQITLQTPFPGTSLHRQLDSQGRLLTERGWSAYTLFDVTYQPDRMTVAELEAGFRDVLANVFSTEPSARREAIRRGIFRRKRQLTS